VWIATSVIPSGDFLFIISQSGEIEIELRTVQFNLGLNLFFPLPSRDCRYMLGWRKGQMPTLASRKVVKRESVKIRKQTRRGRVFVVEARHLQISSALV